MQGQNSVLLSPQNEGNTPVRWMKIDLHDRGASASCGIRRRKRAEGAVYEASPMHRWDDRFAAYLGVLVALISVSSRTLLSIRSLGKAETAMLGSEGGICFDRFQSVFSC